MRVTLLCHAVTEGVRRASFGGDDPPTPAGLGDAGSVVVPRADRALCAPSEACRQTAAHLVLDTAGVLDTAVDDRLAGCDYGRWRGRPLDEVRLAEPDALAEWLADPAAVPHGGESLAALQARIGRWLDAQHGTARAVVAVADAAVIRAAVVYAIEASPRSLWRIDVPPLSRAVLVGQPGRWSLRELGR
ncbi:MAG: histidine phosphatase family protein [Actinomycetota bacterium]|nr:histidine phosphatase family protein [Actinomycetota bacterium]